MSSLITELEQKEILTAEAVGEIRKYIAAKFPSMPSKERARVFADVVNKVVDRNIPNFSHEQKLKLKGNLYKDALSKPVFKLDKSQVFIAALGVEAEDTDYFRGMTSWLGDALGNELDEESVASLIIRVQRLMDDVPWYDIVDALNAVEEGLEEVGEDKQELNSTGSEWNTADILFEQGISIEEEPEAETQPEIDEKTELESQTILQLFATYEEPVKKRRSSLKTHMGNVLVAAGFTGLVLSSLFDLNIFISEGAPGREISESPASQVVIADISSAGSFYNGYLNEKDFLFGNELEASQNKWQGRKLLKATAYDLSIESCGKRPEDPGYGITASGVKAMKGRTIAVDPEYIPLGTKVYITFPPDYSHMDGIYVAEDTGRLIKGWHIDVFFGEDNNGKRKIYQEAMKFGIQEVEVEIIDS